MGEIFCVAEGGLTSPPDHWSLLIVSDLQGLWIAEASGGAMTKVL